MSADAFVILFGCAILIFGTLQAVLYRRIETLEAELLALKMDRNERLPKQFHTW
jgi:hypothetical protein